MILLECLLRVLPQASAGKGPLEGQGGLLLRCSLNGACRKLAVDDEGSEWCPVDGYVGNSFAGVSAKIY